MSRPGADARTSTRSGPKRIFRCASSSFTRLARARAARAAAYFRPFFSPQSSPMMTMPRSPGDYSLVAACEANGVNPVGFLAYRQPGITSQGSIQPYFTQGGQHEHPVCTKPGEHAPVPPSGGVGGGQLDSR